MTLNDKAKKMHKRDFGDPYTGVETAIRLCVSRKMFCDFETTSCKDNIFFVILNISRGAKTVPSSRKFGAKFFVLLMTPC